MSKPSLMCVGRSAACLADGRHIAVEGLVVAGGIERAVAGYNEGRLDPVQKEQAGRARFETDGAPRVRLDVPLGDQLGQLPFSERASG